jgi:hypothetical protein
MSLEPLQCILLWFYLFKILLQFFWLCFLEVWSVHYMIILILIFKETPYYFPLWLHHFIFLPTLYKFPISPYQHLLVFLLVCFVLVLFLQMALLRAFYLIEVLICTYLIIRYYNISLVNSDFVILFNHSNVLLICLDDVSIVRNGILKCHTITVLLTISHFISVNVTSYIDKYMCTIVVISSWWKNPFVIISFVSHNIF